MVVTSEAYSCVNKWPSTAIRRPTTCCQGGRVSRINDSDTVNRYTIYRNVLLYKQTVDSHSADAFTRVQPRPSRSVTLQQITSSPLSHVRPVLL